MQNFQNPITLFHKILACFWLFGMVFLSFGVVTAQTATDRQNHSEVGLMLKPLTAASKWLIRKQVKAFFGDIEAQAVITTNDIVGNILMQVQYAWEKAWQTAILQAALKLISAIFKIISDFVNKLMDMIGNIGNLNAVLAPFASSIVGVARSAYSKVVACADYWARRELQEVLPAIDTGAKGRECPWLNEEEKPLNELTSELNQSSSQSSSISSTEPRIGSTSLSTTEKINRTINKAASIYAAKPDIPTVKIENFINAAADARVKLSSSNTPLREFCLSNDPLFNGFAGVACGAPNEDERFGRVKKDREVADIRNNFEDTKSKVQTAVAGEPLLSVNNQKTTPVILPSKAYDEMVKNTKNMQKLPTLPRAFDSVKDGITYKIAAIPNPDWLDRQLDVLTAQSTQDPKPAGGVDEMFSGLTEQFSKMLNDLITNVLESVIFKIVDFISDNLLKAINFFLGPDSILGGLGLDSVAGDLVNTMRDGIKDSVSSVGQSISDPLAKDRENNLNAVAAFRCDGKLYWTDTSGYLLAKQSNCEIIETKFNESWCKEYNSRDDYDLLLQGILPTVSGSVGGNPVT